VFEVLLVPMQFVLEGLEGADVAAHAEDAVHPAPDAEAGAAPFGQPDEAAGAVAQAVLGGAVGVDVAGVGGAGALTGLLPVAGDRSG